jgi:UPF0271 protein|tara:strand:- start:1921 stop:2655 length:735 start_codon:yes stop_codon:yes gene_type:complete
MKKIKLDINADVGEGIENENELFPFISSCNIACGGHTGNYKTMLSTVGLAKQYNVKIGAHPSFEDRENFGRKILKVDKKELLSSLINQVESLQDILKNQEIKLNHIKAHGALYNLSAYDKDSAKIIIELAKKIDTKLYVPYSSLISKIAKEQGVETYNELFVDRNYNSDLTLVSRENSNALINDSKTMFEHVKKIINDQIITSINNKNMSVEFDTLCIHGDSPNAIKLIKELHFKLKNIGIKII